MNLFFKKYIPVSILFTLFTSIVLMCAVPPVSRDALIHHLAVPALYIEKGNIHDLPDIIPSYYPQFIDLVYCIPLILNNDIAPKYIHFTFALLTAMLIFLYLQQRIGPFYGSLSVLFFLSLPVIVKLSVTVYVDLGLIFFSFAALLCILKWQEKRFKLSWLVLSAVCCGLALSTKYNGLITFFILTAFTPIIYLKGGKDLPDNKKNRANIQLKAVGYGLGFMLIAAVVFSPWMIKNYIWTKNPVYPLYNSYFNPVPNPETGVKNLNSKPSINHFHIRKFVYKESWFETATIPLRIFFQGEDDNPKFFDGRLNPLLFLLPFFAFITVPGKQNHFHSHKKIFFWFSILYILIVFFQQDMRIRWIGPAIAPLVILSAFGLKNIFLIFKSRSIKYFFAALIFCLAGLNAVYIYQLFNKIDPMSYLTNQVTRSEYIEKFIPEYAALQFANKHLDKNTKILAFFLGNHRYYSNHEINFNYNEFKNITQKPKPGEDILHALKNRKFTHLIINHPKFNHWINNNFNPVEKKRTMEFFNKHTNKIHSKNNYGLYELISPVQFQSLAE